MTTTQEGMILTVSQKPRCAALNRRGQPCGRYPIHGATVCWTHGGATSHIKAAAKRRLAEQAATRAVTTLGLAVDISPTEALLEEVRWTAGHVVWLRGKVQELEQVDGGRDSLVWGLTKVKRGDDDSGTTEEAKPSIWYELYARERAHLVNVCEKTIRAGVEERRVRLAEAQGDLLALAITRILEAFGLADDPRVALVVPGVLREIGAGR